jgi:hypothetical protein
LLCNQYKVFKTNVADPASEDGAASKYIFAIIMKSIEPALHNFFAQSCSQTLMGSANLKIVVTKIQEEKKKNI